MYTRILLAYDGSVEGRLALREGARLAQICGSDIFLLSVVGTPGPLVNSGIAMAYTATPPVTDADRETYEKVLAEGVERLKNMGLSPRCRLVFGDPGQQIVELAGEINADLVIVGHGRRGVIARWFQGSVGKYLLDHLHCSMLVGRKEVTDEVLFSHAALAAEATGRE